MTSLGQFEKAKLGDTAAFESLVASERQRLKHIARRFVGHPEDAEDVVQDALLRAYQSIGTVREPAAFSGWLAKVTANAALDLLRKRARWRADAQVHVREHLHATPERERETVALLDSPDHRFDAREHIAFCFTCVARSLPTEEHAALVLRDVLEYSNREAADICGLSESQLRHTLSDARRTMEAEFEGLCGIVSKRGVCYQCAGLRERTAPEHRGPAVPDFGGDALPSDARYRHRLRVVQQADVDGGVSQPLHDYVWRAMERLESEPGRARH